MKTISNIQQLKARKNSLLKEQAMLEEKLRSNWSELKTMLRPGKHENISSKGIVLPNLFKTGLHYGITQLAGRLTGQAIRMLDKLL